jgi:hypothetical protein
MTKALEGRRNAQKSMMENKSGFDSFREKLKKKDPEATKASEDFQKALATGDSEKIAAVKAAHPEFAKAFSYMEGQAAYGKVAADMAVIRFKESLVPEASESPLRQAYERAMELSDTPITYQNWFNTFKKDAPNLSDAEIHQAIRKANPDLVKKYEQFFADIHYLEGNFPAAMRDRPLTFLGSEGKKFLVIDETGRMRVITSHENVLETSSTLNKLTMKQVRAAESLFHKFLAETRFNNSATTLEFMKYLREARSKNPKITMDQALALFQLDASAIVEKYGGGNCFALSRKFAEELKKQGIDAYVIGNYGFNDTLLLEGQEWTRGLQHIERSHGSVVVKYVDPATGKTKYMHFEMGVGRTKVQHYDDLAILESQFNGSGTAYVRADNALANVDSSVLKNQLKVRNKLIVMEDVAQSESFGVDIMKGRIYVQKGSDAADVLEEFAGRSMIDMNKVLREPNKVITVRIAGYDRQMTQMQAATLFMEIVRKRFKQPPDFTENVLYLLTHRDEYYQTFMLDEARDMYLSKHPK